MNWTRRDFLSIPTGVILAGVAGRSLARGQRAAGEFILLRRNVGLFSGRGGTIGWLVNPSGSVVVDSQFPDTASECIAGISERGAAHIDALINSHHHGDHTAGNIAFRDVAKQIVAHENVPDLQRQAAEEGGSGDDQLYADVTFDQEWSAGIGDETVRVRYYGPAHTGGDSVIHFEQADVVHMGDLVFNRLFPFIDRNGGASVPGWISVLESVVDRHSDETLYVFGHGHPDFGVTGGREDVLLQRDFLAAVLETAQRAVAEGQSREEATAPQSLPGFPDYRAPVERMTLGAAIGAAFDELTGT